jgi:ParB family chromosome partitioning protein
MATAVEKITLSASRDIPFNKLVLSQANVRRVKAGVSIEELAEDIARRTLLQSLSVRPVLDPGGQETGMFEVPAGGRRFRALELLVKQKRMAKTQPVPCMVREGGLGEEDSLAENVQRVALHPLDQFRAFQTLREKGLSEEEIAARFFVNPTVVKQRLKLAAVSDKLLDIYAEDGMTLEQLMAFTVTNDHARQEQVWESLARAYNKEPYYIRRQLTEGAVRAADKRARFVGVDTYERPVASCCATYSSVTMAAGSRTRPCSTAWSSRSSRPKRKPFALRAGSGSRSRPTSTMGTPPASAA